MFVAKQLVAFILISTYYNYLFLFVKLLLYYKKGLNLMCPEHNN